MDDTQPRGREKDQSAAPGERTLKLAGKHAPQKGCSVRSGRFPKDSFGRRYREIARDEAAYI